MNFLFRQSGLITRDNIEAEGFDRILEGAYSKWYDDDMSVSFYMNEMYVTVYSKRTDNFHHVHLNTYEQLTELLTFLNDNEL